MTSKKILVAGAGHGGLSAAYHLASSGYDVTIVEQSKKRNLGLAQSDSVSIDSFEKADIPIPQSHVVKRTSITLSCGDAETPEISQLVPEDAYTVIIDRKELCAYLLQLCENVGVNFLFDTIIHEPILLGSRVAGIRTSRGDFYADLILDACGVNTPLRTRLPAHMGIQREPGLFDILHTFRAYYELASEPTDPEHPYKVYLYEDGSVGLQWAITLEDTVDILIGRFSPYSVHDTDKMMEKLRGNNPHLGEKLLRGGAVIDIPVRQPLSVLVADGYAAVGDSAFMTFSAKGSGVGYALRAGKLLSDCVLADTDSLFTARTLWKYQRDFYDKVGKAASIIALAKNLLNYFTADDIRYLIREGILTDRSISAFETENGLVELITDSGIIKIRDMIVKFLDNKELRKKVLNITVWVARLAPILSSMPNKYEPEDVHKWAERYDAFFESIKFSFSSNEE